MSAIPVVIICLMSIGILYWYRVHRAHVDFAVVAMYSAGAFLETLAEPFYNLYYCRLIMLPRLRAEMAAVTCRSIMTFALVVLGGFGIKGFGVAQLAYGAVYLTVMAAHSSLVVIDGKKLHVSDIINRVTLSGIAGLIRTPSGEQDELLVLAAHATGSSLLKHVLTEGDKIVLSVSVSHFNQGIYAITSNYGSLAARIIFQPIEESCRVAFSRMCTSGGDVLTKRVAAFSLTESIEIESINAGPKSSLTPKYNLRMPQKGSDSRYVVNRAHSDETAEAAPDAAIQSMSDLLVTVLRGIILFALVFPVIGAFYSRAAVKLFLGSKWYMDETVNTLSSFCLYILVISVNGVSESFVHAVISPKSLYAFNISLVISWIFFMGSSVPLMNYFGTPGLVIANTVGMVLRSAFNLYFSQSFIKYAAAPEDSREMWKNINIFSQIFPRIPVILSCVMISVVCWASSKRFSKSEMRSVDFVFHIGVGIVSGVLYLFILWLFCREDLKKIINSVLCRGDGAKKDHVD